jgi:hypothetical protein
MAGRTRNYPLWMAIALVVLYVGAAGIAKLAIRPLRALAALGLGIIMIGATYYHATYTPIFHAAPAFVLLILCGYIFWTGRADMLKFGHAG